ncbi:MAG: hypothetical protein J3K34DRAFT_470424 [Monoraphidium minutum]|nr:MAG: hypothetical protein J3K34DRAFT_470424 [Monoraphidium minutum]
MASLTSEATGLIKEMINADGGLPSYNEDLVTRTLGMTGDYSTALNRIMREAKEEQEEEQAGSSGQAEGAGGVGGGFDWQRCPEAAAAVVIYHELIMKIKRILLTYVKMRADIICRMRWEQRRSAKDLPVTAERQYADAYDQALNAYMGFGEAGIQMDLTTDACVKVRVLKSHGSVALSHSAKVSLVKGSVHNMQCSEAEPLIRKGVLQVLDANC